MRNIMARPGLMAKIALFSTMAGLLGGLTLLSWRHPEQGMAEQTPVVEPPEYAVQRSELLVVLPTSLTRLDLVYSSRWWRRGVPTFVVTEDVPFEEQDPANMYLGTWGHTYKDIKTPHTKPGDLRAAIAPFLANVTHGLDSYKWILYGDDDTVFAIDNVIRVLSRLNHSDPYLLSDALWWPQAGKADGIRQHPNRDAPRCLPCNYQDPLLLNGTCPGQRGFIAPRGCPCTPASITSSTWTGGDQKVFDRSARNFLTSGDGPKPGWWYMIHGGAGAIISQGAMRQGNFDQVEKYLQDLPWHSGDAMLTEAMWNVLGIAVTDPGYGYCRPHIQMFDPGWKGRQQHGPEDAHTADLGSDPQGVIKRLTSAIADDECGVDCQDQLQHTLTVHVRARYAEGSEKAKDLAIMAPWHAACRLIEDMAVLFEQYNELTSSHNPAAWRRRRRSYMVRAVNYDKL